MDRAQIEAAMKGRRGYYTASQKCREAFWLTLENREYGETALLDAFEHFALGWAQCSVYMGNLVEQIQ